MQVPAGHLLYFAYGSNMCVPRLRARAPSCRVIGAGVLTGHRLSFHKIGRDGSAKCDAFHTGAQTDLVEGVLYSLAHEERVALDQAEDLGRGYNDRQVQIVTLDGKVTALTYCALPEMIDADLQPFDWYKDFVVTGARHHQLTTHYIASLEVMPSVPDPDPVRAAQNRRILKTL
ncbi:hypothetical protein BOW51_00710 [Solemya velesiana gill symbiont]|uniref:Gamma-glutamylcyclotransferase n=2 Tax=Solemya velesiana gill symbiont TaxID=1918948 RepID=A0A1T2KY78_9GAMM|nr:hypothetical protein BOW51_00710 [Solemya velesiana gill symbiont]